MRSLAPDLASSGLRLAAALGLAAALSACHLDARKHAGPADTTPPSVPAGLTATALSPSRVTLAWSPSTDEGAGVGGYEVLRGGTVLATVAAPLASFEDATVAAGTGYTYTVRAFDRATPPNVSAPSAPAQVTTPSPTDQPGLDGRPANPTCIAPARPSAGAGVQLARVFPNLQFSSPIAMLQAPGDTSRWFVVEQGGTVQTFASADATAVKTTFVDVTGRVTAGGELGLLAMAFHPAWPATKEVFLYYTAPAAGAKPLRSVLSRFTTVGGGTAALDPASEQIVLEVAQPFENHNGGNIAFGADGFLYFGLGDGGSGGDPGNRSQNLNLLLGKFIRIDVAGTGAGYEIPADNPHAGNAKCGLGVNATAPCPEIWAFGFRNPWRWSFDRETGQLWVGDVGQNAYEEVDVVEKGKNYGWRLREGAHCYNPSSGCPTPGTVANGAVIVDPVTEYDHSLGSAITGGYVYRGTAIPSLTGAYVFADYGSGRVWRHDPGAPGLQRADVLDTGINVSSFAEGPDHELYLVNLGGTLHKLVPSGAPATDPVPTSLAATGCVDAADPTKPAAGLIPYRLNAPFWSDGAVKDRWLALPDGQTIALDAAGDLTFPNGTVLMKAFRVGGKLVETRLMMRHPDGVWAGYTYRWNDAQTAATRVIGGQVRALAAQTWLYPTEQQCLQCHTAAAGRALGPEVGQLNGDLTYPATGRTANQLATLEAIGVLSLPGLPATLAAYPDPLGQAATLELRARAYLHSNCSQCHRPGSTAPSNLDFRFATALSTMNACGTAPQRGDLGIAGAKLIAPGHPEQSIVVQRMKALDVSRMPPVGSLVVDQSGVDVLSAWITSLTACD
ncbi:MAG: PQQ-dependent sugar dehydrogenase [Anaeromyxobacteraceae bacterium]